MTKKKIPAKPAPQAAAKETQTPAGHHVADTSGFGKIANASMAKIISVAMLVLAIVVIGVLFFQVMASFFVPLFLAALLVVIFRPLYLWIVDRLGGRSRLASILTTICILLLVLLPAGFVTFIAVAQGVNLFRQFNQGGFYQSLDQIRTRLSLDLPHREQFRQLEAQVLGLADTAAPQPLPDRIDQVQISAVELAERLAEHQGQSSELLEDFLQDLRELRRRAETLVQVADQPRDTLRLRAEDDYASQLRQVRNSHEQWTQAVLGGSVRNQLRLLANPSEEDVHAMAAGAQQYLQPRVLPMTQVAGRVLLQFVIDFGILVIALYFFFADGPSMIRTLMRLSPLDEEYELRLLHQFDQTSRAVVLATVLSALAQALLATLGFWVLGLPSLFLLFLATTFLALIPFLGPAVVWVPVAIYLATVQDRWGAAMFLAIYGLTIVSMIDNVVRMFVLQGNSQLHPLLALLSVLGGLQVFGPIGILVGPMVVVFLQTLLEILNHELKGRAAAQVSQAG